MMSRSGIRSLRWHALAILAACALVFGSNMTFAAERPAPAETVVAFYKWYVHEGKGDQEPLTSERTAMSRYVSKRLFARIDQHKIDSDSDYFTKAQDYMDDWEDSIAVTNSKVTGSAASVTFTMGKTKDSFTKLTVALRIEDGVWKIHSIRDDTTPGKK